MERKIDTLKSNWLNSFDCEITFREYVIRESEEDILFFSWLFEEDGLTKSNLSPIQRDIFCNIVESITY